MQSCISQRKPTWQCPEDQTHCQSGFLTNFTHWTFQLGTDFRFTPLPQCPPESESGSHTSLSAKHSSFILLMPEPTDCGTKREAAGLIRPEPILSPRLRDGGESIRVLDGVAPRFLWRVSERECLCRAWGSSGFWKPEPDIRLLRGGGGWGGLCGWGWCTGILSCTWRLCFWL